MSNECTFHARIHDNFSNLKKKVFLPSPPRLIKKKKINICYKIFENNNRIIEIFFERDFSVSLYILPVGNKLRERERERIVRL